MSEKKKVETPSHEARKTEETVVVETTLGRKSLRRSTKESKFAFLYGQKLLENFKRFKDSEALKSGVEGENSVGRVDNIAIVSEEKTDPTTSKESSDQTMDLSDDCRFISRGEHLIEERAINLPKNTEISTAEKEVLLAAKESAVGPTVNLTESKEAKEEVNGGSAAESATDKPRDGVVLYQCEEPEHKVEDGGRATKSTADAPKDGVASFTATERGELSPECDGGVLVWDPGVSFASFQEPLQRYERVTDQSRDQGERWRPRARFKFTGGVTRPTVIFMRERGYELDSNGEWEEPRSGMGRLTFDEEQVARSVTSMFTHRNQESERRPVAGMMSIREPLEEPDGGVSTLPAAARFAKWMARQRAAFDPYDDLSISRSSKTAEKRADGSMSCLFKRARTGSK